MSKYLELFSASRGKLSIVFIQIIIKANFIKNSLLTLLSLATLTATAQNDNLDSWMINNAETATYWEMGFLKGIDDLIDVQEVCSDSDSLWVKSTAKNAIRS